MEDTFICNGFGYVTFKEQAVLDVVLECKEHLLDGKQIDPKPALQRQLNHLRQKVFVGGLPADLTNKELKSVFSKYGTVCDAHISKDFRTGKSKGFGYVAFISGDDAAKVLNERYLVIRDRMVNSIQ